MSTKDSVNLTKQLSEGFKRSVYWNSYETRPAKVIEQGKNLYELLNASFQGVRRLFVLAYVVAAGATNHETGIKDNKERLKVITYWLMEEMLMINQWLDKTVWSSPGSISRAWWWLHYRIFVILCVFQR